MDTVDELFGQMIAHMFPDGKLVKERFRADVASETNDSDVLVDVISYFSFAKVAVAAQVAVVTRTSCADVLTQ